MPAVPTVTSLPFTVDATLLDLYASTGEPGLWTRALDRLCTETGACSAVVQAFSFDAGGRTHLHWSAQDTRTGARAPPQADGVVDDGNPRLDRRRALRGLNRIARDEELFDPGDDAQPRLQRQLAMLGLGRFIGTLQEVDTGVFLGLALHRPVGDRADFSARQLGRLAELAPHIGQAFVLGNRLRATLALDEQLRRHFDRLRCGLVLCDSAGQVHWLNRAAESLLARAGPLQVVASTLRGRSAAESEALLGEIGAVFSAREAAVRYLRLGHGEQALHVAIQAMPASGSAMLVLTPAHSVGHVPLDALARMFGLTPTEARLVGALVTGSTVEQYAQARGVSVGTARVQLKQAQAKTGAHRQSDLVRLVLSSAAAQLLSPGAESLS